MESIVLHSDVARLVLGYLLKNNLRRAALALCRKSPHLQQEFSALMQGLQPHNFLNGGLDDIIREHVKITGLVTNAVQKLPTDTRYRLQQLKLSELVSELLKLDKSTSTIGKDNSSQRKRRRARRPVHLSDEERPNSATPSSSSRVSCKRPRLLAPYLYCSVDRPCFNASDNAENNESFGRSTTSGEITSPQTDDGLIFRPHGPKNNSTPRSATGDKTDLLMPTPQAMPELTQAILINEDFKAKLLSNINVALQSLTVHAPTTESVNNEAVLDSLVRNILEATEKDPSFDRIIQEVVGMETPQVATVPAAEAPTLAEEPAPPQTPLIIRTAVAAANSLTSATANAVVNGESSATTDRSSNGVIQLNANSSLGTLIDPNFSISKLIVLNSNESAQKQQPPSNLSFGSENIISFGDGGAALNDADAVAAASALANGQVCVDAINGQLTFPMYLSNEGMLSQLPFLLNNEWLAQQLRPDVFANGDISHIEIPLPEPITVTANQLPPQTIIINSAVKQPPLASVETPSVIPPAQLIELPKPVAPLERSSSKQSSCSAVPASLDSSRIVLERVTPSTSGIVNVKAFRSMSTPRKRASHVRTLNFSPKAVTQLQSTPLSTRRPQLKQRRAQLKAIREKKAQEELAKPIDIQPEESIHIKNVDILPNFGSDPASCAATLITPVTIAAPTPSASSIASSIQLAAVPTLTTADVSGNDSNGCVPPLFAMEESSNQTVIKAVAATNQSKKSTVTRSGKVAVAMPATPKRKQKRRAAVKACKRIISQSETLNEAFAEQGEKPKAEPLDKGTSSSLDDSKENEQSEPMQLPKANVQPKAQTQDNDDLMAAWQRQLHASSSDLEQRLREINAKRQDHTKCTVRVRRQRPPNNKKNAAADTQPAAGKLKKLRTPPSVKKKKQKQHQTGGGDVEFNIKILTPQKTKKSASQELKTSKDTKEAQPSSVTEASKKTTLQQEEQSKQQAELVPEAKQNQESQQVLKPEYVLPDERLANMAVLLETPFKMTLIDTDAGDVPPTPCPALMPPLDTPYAKLLPSTSFLFGSDTKSILDTPMLTAITPGMRLTTPFGLVLGTPHSSAAKTDYSSGSSYYRPDEAEHTDTNAQCALQPISEAITHKPEQSGTKLSVACFELHAERLPVEPTVLRRVRSFGSEAVDSAEGAAALTATAEQALLETPHYKLVAGLPDTCIDNSSSSSSASSSTSSSSSSSSSSDSSSSSSNSSASSSAACSQLTSVALPPKTLELLDMENLSDISSTEDEEWLKSATAAGSQDAPPLAIESEPAQLVSQDGEVRYPIRNWLTPSKEAQAVTASTDANTSGDMAPPVSVSVSVSDAVKPKPLLKSAEKVNQQQVMEQRMLDLAKVRERVKAKVRQQVTPKARPKKTNKKLTAIRETAKLSNPTSVNTNKSPKKELHLANVAPTAPATIEAVSAEINPVPTEPGVEQSAPHSNDLDPALLKALNLSAKKQHQQQAKVSRAAVEIAAQPAPITTCRQRLRGRPKKSVGTEPTRDNMRRSTRLIDNKTPDELQAVRIETTKPDKLPASNGKAATKKPAKKRAEARLETTAPTLATVAEAQTTTLASPEQQPQSATSSDYELDMCPSAYQVVNTFSFAYDDNGSKPANPVPRLPAAFFRDYQTRLMVDSEMHTMRITNPQLLYQTPSCADDNVAYANIPKKRIIRYNSSAKQNQTLAHAQGKPMNRLVESEECDVNDMEVASINTPMKQDAGEDQQMEQHDAGVQIEDIESILSHLHGT